MIIDFLCMFALCLKLVLVIYYLFVLFFSIESNYGALTLFWIRKSETQTPPLAWLLNYILRIL